VSTELEKLRAENERLRVQVTELQARGTQYVQELREADRRKMVREFFIIANQERPERVLTPPEHVVRFRLDIVAEEFFEMVYSAFAEEHGP
jgi:predicted HAD superfamily Cof-like phosphohydrolase